MLPTLLPISPIRAREKFSNVVTIHSLFDNVSGIHKCLLRFVVLILQKPRTRYVALLILIIETF